MLKLPVCWRCKKYIRHKLHGASIRIPLAPSFGYIIVPELPHPLCKKCIDSFIQWFKDGI